MAVSDNSDAVREGCTAVDEAMRRAGYGHQVPGLTWVREQLDDIGEDSPAAKRELARRALRWAKDRGLEREEPRPPSEARRRVPLSVAIAYQAAARASERAEELRERYWGTRTAPFSNTREGLRRALDWLKTAEAEDRKQLGDRRPAVTKLVVTVRGDDIPEARDSASPAGEGRNLDKMLRYFLDDLTPERGEIVGLQWQGTTEFLQLDNPDPQGLVQSVPVFPGTRLGRLAEDVRSLAEEAGWWSERQALGYLMCGRIPAAGVRPAVRTTLGARPLPMEITLTLRGPVAKEELLAEYQGVLDRYGLKAQKGLKPTYAAVLQLVAQTPELSWSQRYERWLEWCETNPELRRYPRKAGAQSLEKAFRRASAQVGWDEVAERDPLEALRR